MASMLALLFLLLVVNQGLGVSDPEHLCHKVMTGRFEAINFHSITYYGPHRLWLFESVRKYIVNRTTEMRPEATSLPVAKFTGWYADELSFIIHPDLLSGGQASPEPKAIYVLAYANPDRHYGLNVVRNFFTKECLLAVLIDKHQESIWDIWKNLLNTPKVKWRSDGRVHPDFAIVADQKSDHPQGYMMHLDIYGNTSNLILYDLNVERSFGLATNFLKVRLHAHRLSAPAEERAAAHFFYLEKTEKPEKVRLVHRSNLRAKFKTGAEKPPSPEELKEERQRQLLLLPPEGRQPIGFKHAGSAYLLDASLGCVYIIHDLPDSLETLYSYERNAYARELLFRRTNVPYEEFFRCGEGYSKMKDDKLDPKRCETTIYSEVAADGVGGGEGRGNLKADGASLMSLGIIATFGLLFLLFLGLVACCFCKNRSTVASTAGGKSGSAGKGGKEGGGSIVKRLLNRLSLGKKKQQTKQTKKTLTTSATVTTGAETSSTTPTTAATKQCRI